VEFREMINWPPIRCEVAKSQQTAASRRFA